MSSKFVYSLFLIEIILVFGVGAGFSEQLPSSAWNADSPKIDGVVSEIDNWDEGTVIGIPYGGLWIKNDASSLYVLLNIFCDTHNDHEGDTLSVFFDLDRNKKPSSGDLLYKLRPDKLLRKEYGKSKLSLLNTSPMPGSGFGSSQMEGFRSAKHRFSHRFWELEIPLSELGLQQGEKVRMGVKVRSKEPFFDYGDIYDFSNTIEFNLGSPPWVPKEVMVNFKEGTSEEEIARLEREFKLEKKSVIQGLGTYSYKILSDKTVPEMVELLNQVKNVEYAERKLLFIIIAQLPNVSADWIETADLNKNSLEYQNSRSVALIHISERKRCTGFLVGADILMTANHCVSKPRKARGKQVVFGWEEGTEKSNRKTYVVNRLIQTWPKWDVTLLELRSEPEETEQPRKPGDKWGCLRLCGSRPDKANPVYLIHQHDEAEKAKATHSKKISFGVVNNPDWRDSQMNHDADTLQGSSGAPVFDPETGNVIAFHRGYKQGTGSNIAIKISDFKEQLVEEGLWSRLCHCEG